MKRRRPPSIVTPVAHLVGPGKLSVVNARLAFTTGDDAPVRLDPTALKVLYCYGPVGISDEAFQVLFTAGVEVSWLTAAGHRCQGRLTTADTSGTTLRCLQHQVLSNPEWKLEMARRIVAEKVESQREATRHYQRHGAAVGAAPAQLKASAEAARTATSLETLRGVEGAASRLWFDVLGRLLSPPWTFVQRVRRPPTDPVNALLSLGYMLLLKRTEARCSALGLEVTLGALHEFRPGRPSLACDLMEPLRVPVVDRWVVTTCNQGLVEVGDFEEAEGGIRLRGSAFARTLAKWEENWATEGYDQPLEEAAQGFATAVRRHSAVLPTPSDDVDAP